MIDAAPPSRDSSFIRKTPSPSPLNAVVGLQLSIRHLFCNLGVDAFAADKHRALDRSGSVVENGSDTVVGQLVACYVLGPLDVFFAALCKDPPHISSRNPHNLSPTRRQVLPCGIQNLLAGDGIEIFQTSTTRLAAQIPELLPRLGVKN
ncbi:hypothetical protein HG530_006887 [Fusarium avenaceum]|nr:hypothetical protein HG530_006887 [Fusarium avenaceum]